MSYANTNTEKDLFYNAPTAYERRKDMKTGRLFSKAERRFGSDESFYIFRMEMKEQRSSEKQVTERMLDLLTGILRKHKLKISNDDLVDLVKAEDSVRRLSEKDINCMQTALFVSLLRLLCDAGSRKNEESLQLYENAVSTLRSFRRAQPRRRYLELSSLDRYLRKTDSIYGLCDEETQNTVKGEICEFAEKHSIDELDAAAIYCDGRMEKKNNRAAAVLYFISVYLPAFLLSLSSFFFGAGPLCIFLFFPLSELSKLVTEALFCRILPSKPIPRLKLEKIPDNAITAVAVVTVLTGNDGWLFEKVERAYLSNRDNNALFGILADLPDSKAAVSDSDEEILLSAQSRISALNEKYGNHFFAAVRNRSYSSSERKYIGSERKRGAVIDLANYIKDTGDPFALFAGDGEFMRSCRYLVTLDSDTELFIGAVNKMVGAMLHPANRPVIKDGRVVSGYGVMQPRMAVTTASASKSRFSLLFCGSGGKDAYSSAAFDIYQNLFSEGIFCGKGIIDVDVFAKLIPGAFAPERILSHDLLEGNLLRCGFLSDVVLTDTFPSNPLSYFNRLHRWNRGDVQSLPYAFSSCIRADGKRAANPQNSLSRYKILDNIRRLLVPICAFLAIMLSMLLDRVKEEVVFTYALSYLFFPFLLLLFSSVFKKNTGIFRRYFSRVLRSVSYSAANLFFGISALAHTAAVSLDSLMKSLFRMFISHRRLLQWTPSDRADKKRRSVTEYLSSSVFSLGSGILLLTFAESPPERIIAFLFLLFPLFMVISARDYRPAVKPLTPARKAALSRFAFDMFSYYTGFVTAEDNFLPPDNYQTQPVKALAHRTSPTNIGLYLVSLLAASDFGIISSDELKKRLCDTLSTVEKLPVKHGHLYNWYDTRTLEIIGKPFISTVDSGNFTVCLVALRSGLAEHASRDSEFLRIIDITDRLINRADFSVLYCEDRELFRISSDFSSGEDNDACYDIFMSESRSTSYYAIARGQVPKRHWEKLARVPVGSGGYVGFASWSGTMFEYFMPHLFLPVYRSSAVSEALFFCVHVGKKQRRHGMWGVSESGYYAFDADMNYQYKAHGIQKLALDVNTGSPSVIAPYASFLTLSVCPNASYANLMRLRDFGVYGEHGFCEAVDFSEKRAGKDYAVVKSYMAHHIGMSMIACANACFDDIFVRRFMSDPEMASACELLDEKIPLCARPVSFKRAEPADLHRHKRTAGEHKAMIKYEYPEREENTENTGTARRIPALALISSGMSGILLSSDGLVSLRCGKTEISKPCFRRDMNYVDSGQALLSSLRVFFTINDKCYSVLPGKFAFSDSKAEFVKTMGKTVVKTAFTLHPDKNLFCVGFSASPVHGQINCALSFEPVMRSEEDYRASPFFGAQCCEAFHSSEDDILFFRLRSGKKEPDRWLAIGARGGGDLQFDSRKDVLPFCYGESDIEKLAKIPLPGRTGACADPFAVVRKSLSPRASRVTCEFMIAFGMTREEVADAVRETGKGGGRIAEHLSKLLAAKSRGMYLSLGDERPEPKYAGMYLGALFYPVQRSSVRTDIDVRSIYRESLSGDLPIVCLELCQKDNRSLCTQAEKIIKTFIKLHKLIRKKGIASDLVILCGNEESYERPLSSKIGRLVSSEGENAELRRRSGIFIVNDKSLFDAIRDISCLHIEIDENTSLEERYYFFTNRTIHKPVSAVQKTADNPSESIPQGAYRVKGGFFFKNGFTVIKNESDTPRAFVYSGKLLGTLVTQNSAGFSWYRNSAQMRLTPPSDDQRRDMTSETVIAETNGRRYDIAACAYNVEYGMKCATYSAVIEGHRVILKIGVDPVLPVKLVLVESDPSITVSYEIGRAFPENCVFRPVTRRKEGATEFMRSPYSLTLRDKVLFCTRICPDMIPTEKNEGRKHVSTAFLIGVYPAKCRRLYDIIREKYRDVYAVESGFTEYGGNFDNLFSGIRYRLKDPALEITLNKFIPYQVYVVRMLGRTGYYQPGGAFGFRDQLQDCLFMTYYDSNIAKLHILRACAHQYTAGDVQHWWNPDGGAGPDAGVRTRISDDMLWLPYAVSEYIRVTKDWSLLDIPVRYLESEPLSAEQSERYEIPGRSSRPESVYKHCMRAIDASLSLCTDERFLDLPRMGGGDWNDSFNRVGILGKGVSVWLARFMQIVFKSFKKVCESRNDTASSAYLDDLAGRLSAAAEARAWEKDRYIRGSYDSGALLGSASSEQCCIDILPQAFSVFAEGANDRTVLAMKTAYEKLYDDKNKLFALFTPAFGTHRKEAGYVSGYCEGFRENGGHYTHAAVWGAMALIRAGLVEEGIQALRYINPAVRASCKMLADSYRSEPYAICGDIRTNKEHLGEGGWGLYTGAAGWYCKAFLEDICGYREYGEYFTLSPALSDSFSEYSLRIERKGCVFYINARLSDSYSCTLDRKPHENRFYFDSQNHIIEITVEKGRRI